MRIVVLVVLVLVVGGLLWGRRSRRVTPPVDDYAPGVPLELASAESEPAGPTKIEVRHATGAHFVLTYDNPPLAPDGGFSVTRGEVARMPSSHSSGLLSALAQAHGARVPDPPAPAGPLVLDVGILGRDLTRGVGNGTLIAGEFWSAPKGDWVVLKLFVGEPGEEEPAEIFLAYSVPQRLAEFFVKDPEYWSTLLRVLGPRL